MISTVSSPEASRARSLLTSPLLILGVVCLALLLILTVPTTLPIGPFYWDLFIYFDAANRIFDGQVPGIDFFTPVGPLGYYLFAGLVDLFPDGQPLLIVQWSLFVVTAPILGFVLVDIDRRSRAVALALLLPYLVFQILPYNVEQYFSYPGVDGFGIYNRQMAELLYVLAMALVFVEGTATMLLAVVGTMLALFLNKVTGFAGGFIICAFAFAAGRIALRNAVTAALLFFGILGVLELATGVVSAYVGDIFQLLLLNEGSLLTRFVQAASIQVVAFVPLAILTATLAFLTFDEVVSRAGDLLRRPSLARISALVDTDVMWVGVFTFAALLVETQNTGGQGFIFVWPVLLRLILRCGGWSSARLAVVLTLVAASTLPNFVNVSGRAARAFIGQIRYVTLPSEHLKTLGSVSQRPEMIDRAGTLLSIYRDFPAPFQAMADQNVLPSYTLYTEPDFQLTWLKSVDDAVAAIRTFEAERDVRFETIMSLNFVNPFPWLLDRSAPKSIAIGADPFRAVPHPDAAVLKAVTDADLVLYPRCPITNANEALLDLYKPGLGGHKRVSLSPCWDGFVRSSLLPAT